MSKNKKKWKLISNSVDIDGSRDVTDLTEVGRHHPVHR